MTVPSNTRQTYGAIGIREDLSNIIYNISPMDTPFVNGCGRGSADNTQFEWQTDVLKTAAANMQVEGDDYTSTAVSEPRRLSNYTQISATQVQSSGTAEAVDFAGRKSTQAYQLAKRAKELKRDMEYMMLQGTVKVVGSDGVARQTAAYSTWIGTDDADTTNIVAASDGGGLTNNGSGLAYPDGTTTATTGGANTTTTIALINNEAYVDLVQDKGIDVAIAPSQITIGTFLSELAGDEVVKVHSLRHGAAEAIETIVKESTNGKEDAIGKELGNIRLPAGATIGAIIRKNKAKIAHDDVKLREHDHVILFLTDKKLLPKVQQIFSPS